jgi:hypothetical protein
LKAWDVGTYLSPNFFKRHLNVRLGGRYMCTTLPFFKRTWAYNKGRHMPISLSNAFKKMGMGYNLGGGKSYAYFFQNQFKK